MDALTLLKNDHKSVGAMLDEILKCKPGDDRIDDLAKSIETALTVHAKIEEQYFYPALRDQAESGKARMEIFELYTEHDIIKHLVTLLKQDGRRNEPFLAELHVLANNVKEHVKEEEGRIFPLAEELLTNDERERIGKEMEDLKTKMLGALLM